VTAYEQIEVDAVFDLGSHHFSAEEIKRFAAAYDPQRFHTSEDEAARTHFGALCASGWHTAAVMMRLLTKHFATEVERARDRGEKVQHLGPSPGVDKLKWLKPVYAGDDIAFSGHIVAKRQSRSRPGWGLLSIETVGVNRQGEPVFTCVGHVFAAMNDRETDTLKR
jgi:acyl dehydratase